MDIETGLVTYLRLRAGLTALVDSGTSARIYPLLVPQNRGGTDNYPAVTYQLVSAGSDIALDGPTGLGHPRIQLVAWGRTPTSARAVRDQLHDALTGFCPR